MHRGKPARCIVAPSNSLTKIDGAPRDFGQAFARGLRAGLPRPCPREKRLPPPRAVRLGLSRLARLLGAAGRRTAGPETRARQASTAEVMQWMNSLGVPSRKRM